MAADERPLPVRKHYILIEVRATDEEMRTDSAAAPFGIRTPISILRTAIHETATSRGIKCGDVVVRADRYRDPYGRGTARMLRAAQELWELMWPPPQGQGDPAGDG